MLLNRKAVKEYAKTVRPGIRVSTDYIEALNNNVAEIIAADIRINGGRKTLTGEVIRYCKKFNALATPRRRNRR